MPRTDNDSWDLASSVGSTATMVAAQRVLSNREGLIDDPYAEPLVRAVGLDFFIQALDGEIVLDDVDPRFNMQRAAQDDFAQSADDAHLDHRRHGDSVFFQINKQQTEQLNEHEHEQDIAYHQREVGTFDHQHRKVEKFYAHGS